MDDDDEKDDAKRKSRNLSEKKRRDQFNMLICELCSMVSTNTRKMDKSSVLKSTIAFLKSHNELAERSHAHEIQENWKPSFLTNEEFTHLMLEALDGFIIVISNVGRIVYASESVTSLLGQLPTDLLHLTIYDLVHEDERGDIYNVLNNAPSEMESYCSNRDDDISVVLCHMKRGRVYPEEIAMYEPVKLIGNYQRCRLQEACSPIRMNCFFASNSSGCGHSACDKTGVNSYDVEDSDSIKCGTFVSGSFDSKAVFVATGRLQTPQLSREMSLSDSSKSEFTSRHSLEWKFLLLDHRAPPIIGYLPFEVLGTSGYDYLHVDDLDKIVACHEALMQTGEGTSCYYRFLTKGQQWIWLQTRYYITYHQWNSKPEFIVCTHTVVSYIEVRAQLWQEKCSSSADEENKVTTTSTDSPVQSGQTLSSVARSPNSVVSQSCMSPGWPNKSAAQSVSPAAEDQVCVRSMKLTHYGPSSLRNTKSMITSRLCMAPTVTAETITNQQPQKTLPNPVPTLSASLPTLDQVVDTTHPVDGAPTSLVTCSVGNEVLMTTAQCQLQDQLRRKHQALQEQIKRQQEELHRVHQQLMLAQVVPQVTSVHHHTSSMSTVSTSLPQIISSSCQPQIINSDHAVTTNSRLKQSPTNLPSTHTCATSLHLASHSGHMFGPALEQPPENSKRPTQELDYY